MSQSPFLTPTRPRRGNRRGRAGRRRKALAALTIVVVASLLAARQLTPTPHASPRPTANAGAGAAHGNRRSAEKVTAASLAVTQARSRLGLPLGAPPLALRPADAGEAVAVAFHRPPRAGLLFDLDTGEVLWQRNATQVLPVASLTKMMTALIVAREEPPGTRALVTHNAVNAGGSKVGLLPRGKQVPVQALLYGLLLPSGNDAAIALAEAVSGSVGRFVAKMNDEAARLGLACTRFASPDGLSDGDTSCAVDLAELAAADLAQPRLRPIVASASAVVPFPVKGGKLYLYNNNPLLRYGYPGATGIKTGETEAAGLCLVGTAERHGVRLGVVLLHSPALGRQAEHLLNRAFEGVYHQRLVSAPPVPPGR